MPLVHLFYCEKYMATSNATTLKPPLQKFIDFDTHFFVHYQVISYLGFYTDPSFG